MLHSGNNRDQEYIKERSIPEPYSGCWFWLGALMPCGYGWTSKNGKNQPAHRFSFEAFNGELIKGMNICHRCDERACVNPAHLFQGTPSDNLNDCYSKRRRRAPLSDKKEAIKLMRLNGITYRDIASTLGVTTMAVFRKINPKNN